MNLGLDMKNSRGKNGARISDLCNRKIRTGHKLRRGKADGEEGLKKVVRSVLDVTFDKANTQVDIQNTEREI